MRRGALHEPGRPTPPPPPPLPALGLVPPPTTCSASGPADQTAASARPVAAAAVRGPTAVPAGTALARVGATAIGRQIVRRAPVERIGALPGNAFEHQLTEPRPAAPRHRHRPPSGPMENGLSAPRRRYAVRPGTRAPTALPRDPAPPAGPCNPAPVPGTQHPCGPLRPAVAPNRLRVERVRPVAGPCADVSTTTNQRPPGLRDSAAVPTGPERHRFRPETPETIAAARFNQDSADRGWRTQPAVQPGQIAPAEQAPSRGNDGGSANGFSGGDPPANQRRRPVMSRRTRRDRSSSGYPPSREPGPLATVQPGGFPVICRATATGPATVPRYGQAASVSQAGAAQGGRSPSRPACRGIPECPPSVPYPRCQPQQQPPPWGTRRAAGPRSRGPAGAAHQSAPRKQPRPAIIRRGHRAHAIQGRTQSSPRMGCTRPAWAAWERTLPAWSKQPVRRALKQCRAWPKVLPGAWSREAAILQVRRRPLLVCRGGAGDCLPGRRLRSTQRHCRWPAWRGPDYRHSPALFRRWGNRRRSADPSVGLAGVPGDFPV